MPQHKSNGLVSEGITPKTSEQPRKGRSAYPRDGTRMFRKWKRGGKLDEKTAGISCSSKHRVSGRHKVGMP